MKNKLLMIILAILVAAGIGAALFRAHPIRVETDVGMIRSEILSLNAPPGRTSTELNPAYKGVAAAAPAPPAATAPPASAAEDWPSYNRTLTSDRHSPLSEINTKNVGRLKVLCIYDTGEYFSNESGLLMVNGALIGTTQFDIFSLDPATCAENWRTHEPTKPNILPANRGAAYLDGMLFRGTQDGRVLAFDFKTGKRIWATTIAEPEKGESVPTAPIAWDGLVFIGNAGGDYKGGKGHMYALEAKTGRIVWEFFLVPRSEGDIVLGPLGATPLDPSTWKNPAGMPISGGGTWTSFTLDPATGELYVPGGNPAPDYAVGVREGGDLYTDSVVVLDAKTGNYKHHFKIVPKDWHDWDVSNPPILIQTLGGKKLMAVAPKDGHLYGFDRADGALAYRLPVNRIENVDAPFVVGKDVHFCPGAAGGAEWNSPGYDPLTNLIFIGQDDWCTTVKLQSDQELRDVPAGQPWTGMSALNPFNALGKQARADGYWGGWVYAADADTGIWKWRLRSDYPIVSGMTPTAGGIVMFGDMGGNFYVLDAADGRKLWGQKIGGPIGGGVITYMAGGAQKVAVTTGFTSPIWPVVITTGKVAILGLDGTAKNQ